MLIRDIYFRWFSVSAWYGWVRKPRCIFCICCAVFSHSVVSHFYVYLSIMKIIKIKGHMNILMRVSDVVIEKKWEIWVERKGGSVQVRWENVEHSVLQRNRISMYKKT